MDWLAQNWVWVLVFAAFIGMHLFGHGGHGGHSGHGDRSGGDAAQQYAGGEQPQSHHH